MNNSKYLLGRKVISQIFWKNASEMQIFIVQILHWNKKDIQSWFSTSNKDGYQCSFFISNLEYPGVTMRDMSLLSWPCSLIEAWSWPPGYHCSFRTVCFQKRQKLKSRTWGEGRSLKRVESMSSFQSRRQGMKNHFLRGRDRGCREWAEVCGDKEKTGSWNPGRELWGKGCMIWVWDFLLRISQYSAGLHRYTVDPVSPHLPPIPCLCFHRLDLTRSQKRLLMPSVQVGLPEHEVGWRGWRG